MRSSHMRSDTTGAFIRGVLLQVTPEVKEKLPIVWPGTKLFFLGQFFEGGIPKAQIVTPKAESYPEYAVD